MSRPRLAAVLALIGLAAVVTIFVVVVAVTGKHSSTSAGTVRTIPAADGSRLSAVVYVPKHASGERLPLLIMPASWASKQTEYAVPAQVLSQHGYIVVAYAQRGFKDSGGLVDWALAPTQADVSTVIDWALRHTPADANRIGAVGISYGSSISLLAAERDARIKAVVAMCGWTDLSAALVPNATVDKRSVGVLLTTAGTGTVDVELAAVRAELFLGHGAPTAQMADVPERSPATNVDALNSHHTAVMLANAYQDSIIPPNQVIDFFGRLTGPKRLELDRGGHGGPEAPGLRTAAAARTGVWLDATDWLDRYVRGTANGADAKPPVQVRDVVTGAWHGYPSWPESGAALHVALSGSHTLQAGVPTVAESGPDEVGVYDYASPVTPALGAIPAGAGAVWPGEPVRADTEVIGAPIAHLTITPSGNDATFYTYLYDVAPDGAATLMTYAPQTVSGTAGTARAVDVPLRATVWTVRAGHHLALVADTVDARFLSANPQGSTVAFSSPAHDPSTLTVPIAR